MPRATGRLPWLLGLALLGAVVLAATRLADERALAGLLAQARSGWLAWAGLLQAATYLARGEIWRCVTRTPSRVLARSRAWGLSLAELSVDQALPSGGMSGDVLVARVLEREGFERPFLVSGIAVSTAASYAVQALCVLLAAGVVASHGGTSPMLLGVVLAFVAGCAGLATLVQRASAGRVEPFARLLARLPGLARLPTLLREADRERTRDPVLFLRVCALQLLIVLLDASTLWILVRALGASASPSGVFASLALSSLARLLTLVPGGLGAFEALCVLTLRRAGLDLHTALGATLLFRGLSFWLPMLPGLWLAGRALARARPARKAAPEAYWSLEPAELLRRMGASETGLTSPEAAARLAASGPNELGEREHLTRGGVLVRQLRSPLLLLLIFAAAASGFTGAWLDSAIVLSILLASVWIGYSREYRALSAVAALRARVHARARVLRDGAEATLALRELVPGDVVLLSAGSLVPADGVVLAATDLFVNEAMLTGESFPLEKRPGSVSAGAPLAERSGCVFLGTSVRSGTARCLVVATGQDTAFGALAQRLRLRPPETEFERGLRRFGYLLATAMLVIVLLVFAANVVIGRAPIETLMFSIALAVGLSPELLPAILGLNLARGAQIMARGGVLVRRLDAIEDLGSMDVLCTDKTGTLTEGVVRLEGAWDAEGRPSPAVLALAQLNAALQTGLANPLDAAIRAAAGAPSPSEKLAEIPYDFVRKRLSVVVRAPAGARLVTKGACEPLLAACVRVAGGAALDAASRSALARRFEHWSAQGIRVLAVATRPLPLQDSYGREDERELEFEGFLTFLDQPKAGVDAALRELTGLGVALKLITGDARLVAEHLARAVGLRAERVLTGRQLDELHDEALWKSAEETDLFVEVDPNQKERIILALRKTGHVVGFLGDGINDAPAMHAADTSLSVESAVDVAREAADFVLLEKRLDVISLGIREGRRTFANTLKYVLTTTSANLGNMLSMALASLFLPFLPLLAGQILVNNFLSDVPAVGIADDQVDPELVERPRRWDMRFIGRFMVEFGLLSSLFDLLTFALLLGVFAATPVLFRSAWFVESLLTELVIALVVRTRRPFYASRPGTLLLVSTMVLLALALTIPYLPPARLLGFAPLPAAVLGALVGITLLYVGAAELLKRRFYRGAT